MKKFFILMLASALVLAITLPATAEVEHIFGGYWRVRVFTQQRFSGEDTTEAQDVTRTDTRSRLYYTAKFSDNLKFVNKFEMDAVFGDSGYGDIGADGVSLEVKNSYADFTLGSVRTTLGVQGYRVARGFIFDDDFAGAVIRWNADWGRVPFVWIKAYEGGSGQNANDQDVDVYGINPIFKISDAVSLNPYFFLWYSDDGSAYSKTDDWDDVSLYYLGIDADIKADPFTLWGSLIYNGGDVDLVAGGTEDRSAFLAAGGAKTSVGPVGIHGQVMYASGDDDASDDDGEAYSVPGGDSYYWAEIMGYGTFDNQKSNGSPGNHLSNIFAGNIGFTYTLLEALKLKGDLWTAVLPEDVAGNDYLGTELDIKATYKLMDGLNLDLIAAYLFAGDATEQTPNSADPYELGARFSLSF